MDNRLKLIFECVWEEVAASGGDGDGIVVFRQTDVKYVADQFEIWMKEHPFFSKSPFHRHERGNGHVLFSDNSNENISFYCKDQGAAPKLHELPWSVEIYMEVW